MINDVSVFTKPQILLVDSITSQTSLLGRLFCPYSLMIWTNQGFPYVEHLFRFLGIEGS